MKILTLLSTLFIFNTATFASEKEDVLKAIMLNKISQFISYEENQKEFVICIYNDEDMADTFNELYKVRKYKKLPIKVINITSIKNLSECDIFYAKEPSKQDLKVISSLKQPYTLLVTDEPKFLEKGFMLSLFVRDSKISFSINQQALLDANLKVNYRLLKVASKVINPVEH
ncbi:YfiR family protein [Sulfurimonas sp.]|uniref:YfiR family protein n=1 Tax=Sulfurimonas sp. TaxID=2022749 RepID=UPI002AAF5D16|nr:YfiR family protein [Sulfurimonas sp.]